jgi:ATP-binding cassette subfamily C (CFTR/MRP) protein 1
MVALLRIVELESGSILIDETDISTVGLSLLRRKIATIPQDPTLFSGTIRSNLDPFNEYADDRLLEVLMRVGLFGTGGPNTDSKQQMSDPLESAVLEGGSNFSVGQRQLIVIARALLREASIVILDEATASVDPETDARIQRVMRTEFKHATCITVAHRINTIMDSTYILVMENGRVAEFDSPSALLSKGGLFKDLVDAWEKENK